MSHNHWQSASLAEVLVWLIAACAEPTGPTTFELTVWVVGSGTVTSAPTGIDCPIDCREAYLSGTAVTLTASPGVGSVFGGWSGSGMSCPGTDPCTVMMDQVRSVAAAFTPPYTVVPLETFDGSGQAVHPDAMAGVLAVTPFPFGNGGLELPSVFLGQDTAWRVPGPNPVVRPSGGDFSLSDPDILRLDDGAWRLYYRAVRTDSGNVIRIVESRDEGATWSAPRTVVSGRSHTILSPAVVHDASGWKMWAVDGNIGCTGSSAVVTVRRSADGLLWASPDTVDLRLPLGWPWHVDVLRVGAEYWLLTNGKEAGNCTTATLWFAHSADGVRWQVRPEPVAQRGVIPALADVVYRSTMLVRADTALLWLSGARSSPRGLEWRIVYHERPLAWFSAPPVAVRIMPMQRHLPPIEP